jgi:uncharacterized protein (TIGR00251 family)
MARRDDAKNAVEHPQISVRVQPGARANQIVGWMADARGGRALKVRLRAPAIEGQANEALIEFLATTLCLRARQIILIRGDKSREKVVRIEGATMEEIQARIS